MDPTRRNDRVRESSAAKSGLFSLLDRVSELGLSFVSLAVLGRLLEPHDFGLFGIVLSVEVLLHPLLDMGLTPAYIKLSKADQGAADVFYTLNLLLGAVIALALIVSGPLLASTYNEKILFPMACAFGLSVFVRSMSQQAFAQFKRDRRFDTVFGLRIGGQVSGLTASIGGAIAGLGAWSLLLKHLAQSIVFALTTRTVLHRTLRIMPLSRILQYKSSIAFGAEIVLSRIVSGFMVSLDKLAYGRLFGISSLGSFTRAFQLARMPDSNLRMALTGPALAHLARMDGERRKRSYQLAFSITILVTSIPCTVLFLDAKSILEWLMGSQWGSAGAYLRWLSVWAVGKVLHGLCITMFTNEGRIRAWIVLNILSVTVILGMPIIIVFNHRDPVLFTKAMATGSVGCWLLVSLGSLRAFTGSLLVPAAVIRTLLCSYLGAVVGGGLAYYAFVVAYGSHLAAHLSIVRTAAVAVGAGGGALLLGSLLDAQTFDYLHQQMSSLRGKEGPRR